MSPPANLMTQFAVTGAAIIGVGNGDPNSHEPEKGGRRSLFNGLAQMIVQSGIGRGAVTIRATADGLRPATLRIDRLAVPPRPQVPATAPGIEIASWRRSPPLATAPSPDLAPADNDMNSWATIRAGTPTPPEPARRWWVYRAVVAPSHRVGQVGGTLAFAGIAGRAEVWIDGRRAASKTVAAPGAIEAAVAPGTGPHHVVLIVDADPGAPSGIVGRVSLLPPR